jgi:hypothetical protein
VVFTLAYFLLYDITESAVDTKYLLNISAILLWLNTYTSFCFSVFFIYYTESWDDTITKQFSHSCNWFPFSVRCRTILLKPGFVTFGDIPWPPRSPDLSVYDFFFWGDLKSRVYTTRPRTLDELKQRIEEEIRGTPAEMLQRSMGNQTTDYKNVYVDKDAICRM